MTETAICNFKNRGYYELVDVEDSEICGRMGKRKWVIITFSGQQDITQKIPHNEITIGLEF